MTTPFFTKSFFKFALAILTQSYHAGKLKYDQADDHHLGAFKEGAHVFNALDKARIEAGIELNCCCNDQAHQWINELLEKDNLLICAALFRHKNRQVLFDIRFLGSLL